MRNLAIVLLDQYIDAGFREECDRMAQRQMAREQEARDATEKAKASAEEAAKKSAESAKGERSSVRLAGGAPEVPVPADVVALERAHKRARSVSVAEEAVAGEEEVGRGGTDELVRAEADAEADAHKRARLDAPSGARPVAVAPEAAPHPPLSYDAQALAALHTDILASTAAYSIDQLSRLRAACFRAIWAHRAAWDRTPLVARLATLVAQSVAAVARENARRT
jgi:hypothetical protein